MRFLQSITLIAALLFFIGCSGEGISPTTPTDPGYDPSHYFDDDSLAVVIPGEDSGWTPLFAGTLLEDGDGGFQVVENREQMAHFNITSLVLGSGSFNFQIVNAVGNLFQVNLTLTNPTSEMVFDVWMIFNDIGANKIVNPSSYTTIFSSKISPFIAFAKESPNRMFPIGPGVSDSRTMFLEYNGGPVNFIVVASAPFFCPQPYEISNINLIGQLDDEDPSKWANISCVVGDHLWDLEYVGIDLRIFTGQIKFMVSNPEKPDNFEVTFNNDLLARGGVSYPVWIGAKALGSPFLTYNVINVPVEGGLDPPVVNITTPAVDPFETSARFTTIAGTIDNFEGDQAVIDVNGNIQHIPVVNNQFSEEAVLTVGSNLVKVIAEGPGGIGTDSITIISTAQSADLWVRLTWDKDLIDLDVYITEPPPSNYTCWYGGKVSPHTGARIDLDDVDGYGPEHYYISAAEGHTLLQGTYEIDVHYYSDKSTGWSTIATILAYKNDSYYGEWNQIMTKSNWRDAGPSNRRTGKDSWWNNVANIQL